MHLVFILSQFTQFTVSIASGFQVISTLSWTHDHRS